jgi:hypothetical protein
MKKLIVAAFILTLFLAVMISKPIQNQNQPQQILTKAF